MRSHPLPDSVLIGRVRRAHGLAGELVVEVLTDVAGRFEAGQSVAVVREGESPREFSVVSARRHRDVLLVQLGGVVDRDQAELLRGAGLEVPRSGTPEAPEGAFYYYELVGCVCHDRALGELGSITEVIEDGGGLLLKLEGGASTLLIPFVREYLERVDVEGGRIEVVLPPGLVEICESRS